MKIEILVAAAGAVVLAGCNQGGAASAANEAANAAAAAPKHPTYCFFTDADTKGWKASRDKQGNIVVKGKGHLEDRRYKAELIEPEVSGTTASIWLQMSPNYGPTGALENWWDVSAAVPASSGAQSVTVMCGKKTVAQLTVAPAKI